MLFEEGGQAAERRGVHALAVELTVDERSGDAVLGVDHLVDPLLDRAGGLEREQVDVLPLRADADDPGLALLEGAGRPRQVDD